MLCNIVDDFLYDFLIVVLLWLDCSLLKPCGRPCDSVDEHALVLVKEFVLIFWIKHFLDIDKYVFDYFLFDEFHGVLAVVIVLSNGRCHANGVASVRCLRV